jgi:hypothetical protein
MNKEFFNKKNPINRLIAIQIYEKNPILKQKRGDLGLLFFIKR